MNMKNLVGQYVFLSYNNFSEEFIFHIDDKKTQLRSVIIQNWDPITFYSLKLTHAQINYTPTEKELLSVVETLKELCSSILGLRITVYTYHNNLTYDNFITEILLC